MSLDIFSNFDDKNKILMEMSLLMWLLPLITMGILMKHKPMMSNSLSPQLILMKTSNELASRTQAINMGGSLSILTTTMTTLLLLNLTGIIPYVFSLTSHLAINLSIALPLWISTILLSISYDIKSFLIHLQPLGAPVLLNPFLSIIELISNLMRPVTLSVRMTANLSTGHILLNLMGNSSLNVPTIIMIMLIMLIMFYLMFESLVSLVQSYIFTLLPTLYLNEHPTKKWNIYD